MITDNQSFYLCNVKDFQKVIKKSKLGVVKDINALQFMSQRSVSFFDDKGVAYWAVPFNVPYPGYESDRQSETYEQSVEYYLWTLRNRAETANFPSFRVRGWGLG